MADIILSAGGRTVQEVQDLQKAHFLTRATFERSERIAALERLEKALRDNEALLTQSLQKDLGRSSFEAYIPDIGLVLEEISYAKNHLKKWMKPKKRSTPISLQPSKSYEISTPLGQTLIIGPWNYPIQLLLIPAVGALAAGNTVVLKPSELTVECSKILEQILSEAFDESHVAVFTGGIPVSTELLAQAWDHIFFTGSTPVGRVVAKAAAATLSPATLELGGKSPVFVTADADLKVAARRITYGKYFNAGQTCVSPDYALVHSSHRGEFVELMKEQIRKFYGNDPKKSPDFARIVNERNLQRLLKLIDNKKIVAGGESEESDRYLAPTILDDVEWGDAVMSEEIFGPILPVIYYDDLSNVLKQVESQDKPLAAYIFSESSVEQRYISESLRFGGGCINDTMVHVSKDPVTALKEINKG